MEGSWASGVWFGQSLAMGAGVNWCGGSFPGGRNAGVGAMLLCGSCPVDDGEDGPFGRVWGASLFGSNGRLTGVHVRQTVGRRSFALRAVECRRARIVLCLVQTE